MDATMFMKKMDLTEIRRMGNNNIYLIIIGLLYEMSPVIEKRGIKKLKAYPTMFMKTKENESDKWAYPTMLMKTNIVNFCMPRSV